METDTTMGIEIRITEIIMERVEMGVGQLAVMG